MMPTNRVIHYSPRHGYIYFDCAADGSVQGEVHHDSLFGTPETSPPKMQSAYILFDSSRLLLTTVNIPARNRQQLMQALPYSLEEYLIGEPEQFDYIPGERDKNGEVPVAVVGHDEIVSLNKQLQESRWEARQIIPDVLAAPKPETGWGILLMPYGALVRTAEQNGFYCETENLPVVLQLALQENTGALPTELCVYRGIGSPDIPDISGLGVVLREEDCGQHVVAWFGRGLRAYKGVNLVSPSGRGRQQSQGLWRPWRLSFGLLGVWLLLTGLAQGLEYTRLQKRQQQLEEQIATLFQDILPGTRMVNPAVQVQRVLEALAPQSSSPDKRDGLLWLLTQASPVLGQTQGLHLQRLDYGGEGLELSLRLDTVGAFESLRRQLQNQGLDVSVDNLSSRDKQVEARLRLTSMEAAQP